MSNEFNVKKAYADLVSFLDQNRDKKVDTVFNDVVALCSPKSGGAGGASTFVKDANGDTTAVFCYYHKKWEDVTVAEYGAKATSATGLNNMCKEGTSNWTKQNRLAKKEREDILNKVATGEITPDAIADELDAIEEARALIEPRTDGHGTDQKPA